MRGALRQSHDCILESSYNYIAATCVYFVAMKVVFDLYTCSFLCTCE